MKDPNIKVPIGFGTVEYTQGEIAKEILDLHFLKEAFLVLLNPEATRDSDITLSRSRALSYARQIYKSGNWNQEFIDKCFRIKN